MHLSSARLLVLTAVALSLSARPASGQDDGHVHPEAGSIPLEILQRPVTLRNGIGRAHEAVTTSSKEAQAFYDQGRAYLHSYVWIEAARSFYQALRFDPKLAMGYVGLSRALSGLNATEAARAALNQAVALAGNADAHEQRHIAIRLKQMAAIADPGNPAKQLEYKKAIDDALAAAPNDAELWLLRGNAEEPTAAGRGQRGTAASIVFYQRALSISPDHFGAHHYLVHSYENIGRIQDALSHGEAYARLAPAVPHAHHMYGHDLRRVGRIDDAIAEFRKAYELERSYYESENIPAEYDWHHQHNLDLLSTSYQYQGQMKAAEELMRQSFAISSTVAAQEFNKREWPAFLLARRRLEEALDAASTLTKNQSDLVRAIGHVMAAHALMAMNRIPAASEQAKEALREVQNAGARADLVRPYVEVLQGEFFLRTGQAEKGRALLKLVQQKVRADPGPDAWTQALFTLESIARTAWSVGDWELAEYTAEQMRQHDPAYAGTHYALALVAEHKGNRSEALQEFKQAEKYWREADSGLPELQRVRSKIAELGR